MGVIRNNFNNFENSGAGAVGGGGDDDWIYISSDGYWDWFVIIHDL